MKRAAILLPVIAALNPFQTVDASEPMPVRAQSFDVAYAVSESALPLTQVDLWFTCDEGLSWELYGKDEDRHSPMRFHAPAEGLFGFFLVLHNPTGASSAPPAQGDKPHQWAFVDYTQPVVQLHPPRFTTSFGERLAQIRWTAVDAQLGSRPVQVEFRDIGSEQWQCASAEPLSNTGRFDWRLPPELKGTVSLRVAVTDRGGNRTLSDPQTLVLQEIGVPGEMQPSAKPAREPVPEPDVMLPGSERAKQHVAELLGRASESSARGDLVEAIALLREVVRLDPQRTEAFTSLGGLLRQSGDLNRAMHAYEIALQQQPQQREALLGSALVLREKRDYEAAANRLRTVLRYVPQDAEAWMMLGDVAVFQGNELLARDCYKRATHIDPAATDVIAEAEQRLAILTRN